MKRLLPGYRVSLRIEARLNQLKSKNAKDSKALATSITQLETSIVKHLKKIERQNEAQLENLEAKIVERLDETERKNNKRLAKLESKLMTIEKSLKSQRTLSHNLFFLAQANNEKHIQQAKQEFFMNMPKAHGDLRIVQEVGTYLLKNFKQLCDENGLRYWLESGTLIGAIRHHGFVPWDDDIDVGMPRHDHERLRSILQNNQEFKLIDIYYISKKDGRRSMTTKFAFRDPKMPISIDLDAYEFLNVDDLDAGWKIRNDWREAFSKEIESIEPQLRKTFCLEEITDAHDLELIWPIMAKYTSLASELQDGNAMCLAFHKFVRWKWIFAKDVFFPLADALFEGETYNIPNRALEHLRLQHHDIYEIADSLGKSKKIDRYKWMDDLQYQKNYLHEKGYFEPHEAPRSFNE